MAWKSLAANANIARRAKDGHFCLVARFDCRQLNYDNKCGGHKRRLICKLLLFRASKCFITTTTTGTGLAISPEAQLVLASPRHLAWRINLQQVCPVGSSREAGQFVSSVCEMKSYVRPNNLADGTEHVRQVANLMDCSEYLRLVG